MINNHKNDNSASNEMDNKEHIVISLGGSLIAPNGIDIEFLKNFVSAIKTYIDKGFRFVVITGGGHTARAYINASKEITNPTNTDLDWIGIATTRINAELLRISFGDLAYHNIIMDPDSIPVTDKPIMVGGGWKPGNSSDLAAVHIANRVKAKKVINLSNIDYVYDKDPNKFTDAVVIKETTWPKFRALLPIDWDPGLNAPFDPIAAKESESLGLEVIIMNGKNIENFNKYIKGEEFIGTVVK